MAFDSDIGTNAEIRFALVGKKIENERYRIDAKTGEVFGVLPLSVGEDYNVMVGIRRELAKRTQNSSYSTAG